MLNNRGNSILTVLIALGMAGVLGMTLMTMMKNTTDMYQANKARESADSARFIAQAILQNSEACKKSLIGSGLALSRVEGQGGVKINKIVSKTNKEVFSTKTDEGPVEMVLEPLNQDRSIAAFENGRYLAQLRMKFKDPKDKTKTIGGGVADRILPIVLSLENTTVKSCRAGSTTDDDSSGLNCLSTLNQVPAANFTSTVVDANVKAFQVRIPERNLSRLVGGGSGRDGSGSGKETVTMTVPGTSFDVIMGKTKVNGKTLEAGKILRRVEGKWYYDNVLLAVQDRSQFNNPMSGSISRKPGSVNPTVQATSVGATCPKNITGQVEASGGSVKFWGQSE